jgi:hypothetical protein
MRGMSVFSYISFLLSIWRNSYGGHDLQMLKLQV